MCTFFKSNRTAPRNGLIRSPSPIVPQTFVGVLAGSLLVRDFLLVSLGLFCHTLSHLFLDKGSLDNYLAKNGVCV